MASFQQHVYARWRVHCASHLPVNKTYQTESGAKAAAERLAGAMGAEREGAIAKREFIDCRCARRTTLGDLLRRDATDGQRGNCHEGAEIPCADHFDGTPRLEYPPLPANVASATLVDRPKAADGDKRDRRLAENHTIGSGLPSCREVVLAARRLLTDSATCRHWCVSAKWRPLRSTAQTDNRAAFLKRADSSRFMKRKGFRRSELRKPLKRPASADGRTG